MKLATLFSGGKDSTFATYLAKKEGHEIVCLMSMFSENKDSYMFHTPSISKTKKQAEVMGIPLIVDKTKGEKEKELEDLARIIKRAKEEYGIDGIITGALHSNYQASRIQKICDDLDLKCLNPLWHKNEFEYLQELIDNNFDILIVGVSAYPLDESWLGRKVDEKFIEDVRKLYEKYKIHPAGEGGEFESFVLNCPLFERKLELKGSKSHGDGNYWRMEIEVE
jgi:asparagine synthase (glutamine-hydrolysing)